VLTDDLQKEFGIGEDDVLSSEHFGPSVGKELKANALKALLLSAIGMLIYIRIRFREWKFGSAALIGTLHDVLVVVAFYAVFNVTVNNPFIAAILTVVGYSINDTIVIFDRIRENLRFMHKNTNEEIIDISINQTLSRSIMTSATTLIVMVPLYIMASDSIREFVLPLMIGVLAGCLSSIFVCSPLYYEFSKGKDRSKYEKQIAKMKKEKKAGKETAAAELPAGSEHKEPPKGHKKKSREARRKDEK
ncbi:MAG: protein translocase subunit SecF, partial [Anaerovoracaceae bacterium]